MIRRARPPLLLARPTGCATVSAPTARLLFASLAGLIVLSWVALALPEAPVADGVALNAGLIDAVWHGGSYYPVAADLLRAGDAAPDAAAVRPPALALVLGGLPAMGAPGLLALIAAGTVIAWLRRLRPEFTRQVALAGVPLLFAAGAVAVWRAEAASTHEVWAGLLVALSLARRAPGRWAESLGWGLLAALVRETAAVYLVVMLCLAWHEGERREAKGWAAALIVAALTVAAHLLALDRIAGTPFPSELPVPDLGAPVRAWCDATALGFLPTMLAGPLLALALTGWTVWRDPLAVRVVGMLAAATLLGALGSSGAALLTAPVLLIGLAFAPDALRDLASAALDMRRITVRRVAP